MDFYGAWQFFAMHYKINIYKNYSYTFKEVTQTFGTTSTN